MTKKTTESKAQAELKKDTKTTEQGRLAPPDKEKIEQYKTEVVDRLAEIETIKENLKDEREKLSEALKKYKEAKGTA